MSERVREFSDFVAARDSIRVARKLGKSAPWTNDPILQKFRFCNVRREDDRTTIWIKENWRAKNAEEPYVWFAMLVARFFNLPSTLALIKPPVKQFDPQAIEAMLGSGKGCFSPAYMVRSNPGSKVHYVLHDVLQPIWDARRAIMPEDGCTLEAFHRRLMGFSGIGSFMAGQCIADAKYTACLSSAPDWHTWAAMGPGSARGLNRVYGFPVDDPWRPDEWLEALQMLRREAKLKIRDGKTVEALHAQDVQNCLCEFDKYERVRLGEGRPKQLFTPFKEGKTHVGYGRQRT